MYNSGQLSFTTPHTETGKTCCYSIKKLRFLQLFLSRWGEDRERERKRERLSQHAASVLCVLDNQEFHSVAGNPSWPPWRLSV